jgi:hypothetical protein
VERPAEIVVRVSSGVPMTTVPDLVEIDERDARRELEAAGLDVQVSYEEADRVEPGAVLSQDPAAGASVAQGSEVALVVASEPEDSWKEVFTLGGDETARTPLLFVGERWRIAYAVEADGSDGVEVRVLQGRSTVDGFRAEGADEGRWDGPSGGGPVMVEVVPDGAAEYRLVIEELG